jgi:hypothetical protein
MTLDSARVRLANRLASEVRIGAHLGEVLGREVERIFATKSAVDTLRDRYRLHDANQGRRVCDGQKVLARTTAQLSADTGLMVRADQERRLDELREAIDVYGDLLVADAVFDVVSGRGDTAGAAMEAAAGLDLPPDIDVIRTPRSGRTASTVLMAVLPPGDGGPPGASPVWLAEPALASYVRGTFPPAAQWRWTREDRVQASNGTWSTVSTAVSLADLGLEAVDLIVLDPEQVAGLVIQHTSATAKSLHPSVRPGGPGPELHARVRRLSSTLSGAPALPSGLTGDGHKVMPSEDRDVIDDLWERYRAVHEAASTLRQDLGAAAAAVAGATDGAPELARAWRWGIVPVDPPETTGAVQRRREVLTAAAEILQDRLGKAPEAPAAPPDGITAERIARAIGDLVGPGGRLPVLSRIKRSQIASLGTAPASPPMNAEPFESIPLGGNPGAGRNRLDRTWLEIVASVRQSAGRIESYQLEAMVDWWPSFRAWTNSPGDPWQESPPGGSSPPVLFVAYGPSQTLDGAADPVVAAAVLDSWTETIPSEQHTVSAAFGFNAPAARAPQAILVAVTPVDGSPLDVPTLLDILIETRELAHARMATARDLQPLAAALPMTMLPTRYSDRAGLELGSWEL